MTSGTVGSRASNDDIRTSPSPPMKSLGFVSLWVDFIVILKWVPSGQWQRWPPRVPGLHSTNLAILIVPAKSWVDSKLTAANHLYRKGRGSLHWSDL